ncbi:hypothetical protein SAMN05446037_100178 [Anaerovirgula multivorans]|uniref:Uncharacterized protein n=1 Tax=Anaerovirgula multivorans TaxID=312168 RepID=A0A238ZSD8_9FIRM|nr:hypothetical protein [Anaerovirgula multivorans]SNR86225.1 hypothetical protein SAMN05446037_100178 [Anaerovirgula multivorans]
MAEISIAKETTSQAIKTKVDTNLDTTVSSRQANVLSQTQANRLDDTISSRMPGTTTHRDRIDTTISSRQAAWGATTTHRDRIDTTISSRAAQTTANTINTNVGSNSDASSATGSTHAKLKDIRAALNTLTANLIQPTKPRSVDFKQSDAVSGTWYTVLNITGKGILNRLSAFITIYNEYLQYEITVDGVAVTETTRDTSRTRGLAPFGGSYDRDRIADYLFNTYFKSSLKIRVRHTHGSTYDLHASVDYALV